MQRNVKMHAWGGHWGVGQFFLRYFGNFKLNCSIAVFSKPAGCIFSHFGRYKKFSFKSSNVFRAFSSFRSFHFLLIISQHASECYLFCLFCLNRTFPNLDLCFRVIAVLVWHRVSTRYCNIAVFGDIFAILRYLADFSAVLRSSEPPNCPPRAWTVEFIFR